MAQGRWTASVTNAVRNRAAKIWISTTSSALAGIFVFIAVAWGLSSEHRNVNWRVIGWGVTLQLAMALFIFVVPAGTKVFLVVNDVAVKIIESAGEGAEFVFGRLALGPGQTGDNGEESLGFILAFQGFPTIIFFSALIAILYYLRIMPPADQGLRPDLHPADAHLGSRVAGGRQQYLRRRRIHAHRQALPGPHDALGDLHDSDGRHGDPSPPTCWPSTCSASRSSSR